MTTCHIRNGPLIRNGSLIHSEVTVVRGARSATASSSEAETGPGDVVFVPRGWWHMVSNQSDLTVAVSHHFVSPAGLANTLQVGWSSAAGLVVGRGELNADDRSGFPRGGSGKGHPSPTRVGGAPTCSCFEENPPSSLPPQCLRRDDAARNGWDGATTTSHRRNALQGLRDAPHAVSGVDRGLKRAVRDARAAAAAASAASSRARSRARAEEVRTDVSHKDLVF